MQKQIKKTYIPNKLPPKIDFGRFVRKIAKAHEKVARYDEAIKKLPNPAIVQRTLDTKEAVLSSQIEGTQVTLDEVFLFDAQGEKSQNTSKEQDYREVFNYRWAIYKGKEILDKKPFSENVVKELHKILLRSVRGKNKAPGEFRRIQVFIGSPGASIEEASFVPMSPEKISPAFADLEKFIHYNNQIDEILKAGIMHFQFEAIHPFLDGNGRIGRLLIPLLLYEKGLTHYPNVYISEYLENNRQEYYARLRGVSESNDWYAWLNFFLEAVIHQTQESYKKVRKIEEFYNNLHSQAPEFNSIYASKFIDALFIMPRFSVKTIKKVAKIGNTQTLYNLIEKFKNRGLIVDMTPKRERGKIYGFKELLEIIR